MFNPGLRDQLGQLPLSLAGPFTAATAKLPSEPLSPNPLSEMSLGPGMDYFGGCWFSLVPTPLGLHM